MNKLFGYDSKAMQILGRLGDLILLNLLYIVCCIPIITIGAAQAGLYRAVVALRDPESDYTMTQAFFMGFKDGFGRITIAWCIMLVLILAVVMTAFYVYFYENVLGVEKSLIWISIAAAVILMMIQSVMTLFHSKFGCGVFQLFRNALMMILFNLWRCLIVCVMTWLPTVLFAVNVSLFLQLTPLWFLGYYAICFYFIIWLFRVPFAVLVNHYNDTHGGSEPETEEDPEDAEIEQ